MDKQTYDMINSLKDENLDLKENVRYLSNAYINLFIEHCKTLDLYLPEWREHCQKRIDELLRLLK